MFRNLRLLKSRICSAHEVENGMIIKHQGYVEVLGYRHLKTSQGRTESIISYMDLNNLTRGKMHVNTDFKLDVIEPSVVSAVVQYWDHISKSFILSNSETFEEYQVPNSYFAGAHLKSGQFVSLLLDEEVILKVGLPSDLLAQVKFDVSRKEKEAKKKSRYYALSC